MPDTLAPAEAANAVPEALTPAEAANAVPEALTPAEAANRGARRFGGDPLIPAVNLQAAA